MSSKVIVCRCEDVTLGDIGHAMSLGYVDIEEVKRYTGLGTGPCEGKECMALCARLLWERSDGPLSLAVPFTARPPVVPVALGVLARGAPSDRSDDANGSATDNANNKQ